MAEGDDNNWLESIPEELRGASFIKPGDDGKAKPLSQVVADLNDAAQYMGNSLRIPGPDAGEDKWKEFHTKVQERVPGLMPTPNLEDPESLSATFGKLGRPEGADGYKTPEGVDLPPEQLGEIKALAHKANMTQHQFNDYLSTVSETHKTAAEQATAKHQEAITALKGEWGAAYDQRVGQVADFLKTNGTTPAYVIEALEAGSLPADQVRWLHSLADTVSNEDGQFHRQEGDTGQPMLSPEEAKMRVAEIVDRMYDRNNPPSSDEVAILDKKQEAYEHLARGRKPPAELMRYI